MEDAICMYNIYVQGMNTFVLYCILVLVVSTVTYTVYSVDLFLKLIRQTCFSNASERISV